ncbi:DUF4174 domain-containing protein [Photobacterium minamisatsumaniensis]|uniref:DUF4174 domain-containing protein n=1 Tax=Photobacterium minamisatsumaniensis TaxID=2910233 RepID=UPI003D134D63
MKIWFIQFVTMFFMFTHFHVFAYPTGSIHWNHRSILYFAPEKDQHVNNFIKQSLMHDCQLQERDIKTVVITHDGFYKPENAFTQEEVQHLTSKYNITSDSHTAILIGKDGLEKHRWGEKTNWLYIHQLIDDMPLRKKEIASQPTSRCAI